MRFEKWQALGNDYLIVEHDELTFELTPARVRMLCDVHTGVGADGVLLLCAPADPHDVADLRIFNPDGSEAELTGNCAREAILYLRRRGWTDRDSFSIATRAGRIRPTITGPFNCRVDMGRAQLRSRDYPSGPPDGRGELHLSGPPERRWRFQHVSVGNPQCAIRVASREELAALELALLGPPIEAHPDFPNRTNVSWYAEEHPGPPALIRARIFERGVGETRSSGTGAAGAAVAYVLEQGDRLRGAGGAGAEVTVALDGGELLVEIDRELGLHLSGWARPVYAGRLGEEMVSQLHATADGGAVGQDALGQGDRSAAR
jgi:diaminopimelate epimerase